MSENLFDKFNGMFDMDGLKSDIADAASNNMERVEVPEGDYEVKVTKLELGATGENSKTPGMPMAKVWFKIISEGAYKGQMIFMNQMLTTGFGIHKMNEFLTSLQTDAEVSFENFTQYANLMAQVFGKIDGRGEYQLSYGKNNKGYSTYTIVKRFA